MSNHQAWVDRQERDEESRREYEKERLILWSLEAVSELMVEAGVSKADLARKLGTSRAHITQLFSGTRNATLGTVSDLAWACGKRAVVKFEPLRSGQFISSPVRLVDNGRMKIVPMSNTPRVRVVDDENIVEYTSVAAL